MYGKYSYYRIYVTTKHSYYINGAHVNNVYLPRAISFLQQGLMLLLQNLPTSNWSDSEISLLVAEAFRLKYVFADAPNHLQANKK